VLRSLVVNPYGAILGLALLLPALPASTAIWPNQLGAWAGSGSQPLPVADRALWSECGLQQAEQAEYSSGARRFHAEAYRLQDSTGALAAFDWQRPSDSRPSKLADLAAETADGMLLVYHNYLLRFAGWKPTAADLAPFLGNLRDVHQAPLPTLKDYLPAGDLVPNSERYVLGPASLERFEPRVPASVAAFHLGAEACLAQYRTKSDPLKMSVFSYPTPQIARQRLPEFEKLPGAMARRSGTLVAVVFSPFEADGAERLLSQVRYQASITVNERVPTARDNIGNLIVNIFTLIGILLVMFLVAGLAFAFLRRWLWWGRSQEAMIVLHLEDRQ
jgi:hypothetical protein